MFKSGAKKFQFSSLQAVAWMYKPGSHFHKLKKMSQLQCDGVASHPEGSRNTPSCFMLQKLPLQNEFPAFWEFLGIPRNSQVFPEIPNNYICRLDKVAEV